MDNLVKFPTQWQSKDPRDNMISDFEELTNSTTPGRVVAYGLLVLEEDESDDKGQRLHGHWGYKDTHGILTLAGLLDLSKHMFLQAWTDAPGPTTVTER